MFVIYNPVIILEVTMAGVITYPIMALLPEASITAISLVFFATVLTSDLLARRLNVWRRFIRACSSAILGKPQPPLHPHTRSWRWLVTPDGGHLFLVPCWLIALLGMGLVLYLSASTPGHAFHGFAS